MKNLLVLFALVTLIFLSKNVTAQSDLVAYWKFDEGYGSTVIDISGYGNTGTVYGANCVTDCKSGSCLKFDGIDDYIQIPHSNSISGFANGLTASFWIKLDNVTKRQSILNKYNSAGNQRGWFIEYNISNGIGFYASSDGINYYEWHSPSFIPTVGIWYHVAVAWQSNTIPKFYINAQLISTVGTATISNIYNNSGVSLYIGKSQYDSSRNFKGTLDEVKIWNRVLTVNEVIDEYETDTQKLIVIDSGNKIGINKLNLGIQTDWSWTGFVSNAARRQFAQDANIKLIRTFDFRSTSPKLIPCEYWNETTKNCNKWNWTSVDLYTQTVFGIGAEPLFCLGWARDNIQKYIPSGMVVNPNTGLPYPDSYASYAKEWVKHFKTTGQPVRYYEIMNEPNAYFDSSVNYTKLNYFIELWNASARAMRAENPSIFISHDLTTSRKVLDYWVNHGEDIDFLDFHKYDSGVTNGTGYYDDDTVLMRAETSRFQTSSTFYSPEDARQIWLNSRGELLPVINSESNFNSAWENGTDPRIQKIVGAVWSSLVLRMAILKGLSYNIYYEFSSSGSWETNNKPSGGYGFGIINSDNNRPWYPYYVYKWIGNNLAVGDSIVNSTSYSDYIRSLAWINNGRLNILLVNKLSQTKEFSLQGVTGPLIYQKIDDPTGASYLNPIVQTGTIDASSPIVMNGYTVMLLQSANFNYSTGFLYGVCAHPWALTERDFQEMKTLGVKYVRMDFRWTDFEASQDVYTYSKYDQFVAWSQIYGVEIIAVPLGFPSWASGSTTSDVAVPPLGASFDNLVTRWGMFISKIVSRYKGSVNYFEIWNEPSAPQFWTDPDATYTGGGANSGPAITKYVRLLNESYAQAKAANPNCKIVSAGIGNEPYYLTEMYQNHAQFDLVAVHPYFVHSSTKNYDVDYMNTNPNYPYCFGKIQSMRDIMIANGDSAKKILITEIGIDDQLCPVHSNVTPSAPEGHTTQEMQADRLTRVFQKTLQEYPYVQGIMWYQLKDTHKAFGAVPKTDSNWGLFRMNGTWDSDYPNVADYTPRLMYYAYKNLIGITVKFYGRLIDKNNNTLNANITIYQKGTSYVNASNSTISGSYNLSVRPSVYDIQYNLLNFPISNFWIKLLSINVISDIQDLVNYIADYPSTNKVSFTVNANGNQVIQAYSLSKPNKIKINNTEIAYDETLSSIPSWSYNVNGKIINIKFSC